MERRQHAIESYGTEPEITPFSGIEVVHNSSEKYYVSNEYHQKLPVSEGLPPKNRICGLSRGIFLLTVAMSVLAMVVIGLGAGLGVALNKVQTSNADNTAADGASQGSVTSSFPSPTSTSSSTSAPASSTPSSIGTVTTTSSSFTSSASPKPSNICPGADNTVITATLGDVRYRVACDSDFSGSGKQTLASFFAATWDDCLKLCNTMNYFQDRTDVGCTWNVAGTGQQTPGTCWCLGGADKTVVSNEGNVVAVPL